MGGREPPFSTAIGALLVAVLSAAACTAGGPVTLPERTSTVAPVESPPIASALADVLAPVSRSNPAPGAADALAKCHIGDTIPIDKVTGMGEIGAASDVTRYVRLTGREPQLRDAGPAWVITVRADLPQPPSSEVWSNPTCVVTQGEFGWYATGPVRNTATGALLTPEVPAVAPDRTLPPLAP
jgi:hypothetical protein